MGAAPPWPSAIVYVPGATSPRSTCVCLVSAISMQMGSPGPRPSNRVSVNESGALLDDDVVEHVARLDAARPRGRDAQVPPGHVRLELLDGDRVRVELARLGDDQGRVAAVATAGWDVGAHRLVRIDGRGRIGARRRRCRGLRAGRCGAAGWRGRAGTGGHEEDEGEGAGKPAKGLHGRQTGASGRGFRAVDDRWCHRSMRGRCLPLIGRLIRPIPATISGRTGSVSSLRRASRSWADGLPPRP